MCIRDRFITNSIPYLLYIVYTACSYMIPGLSLIHISDLPAWADDAEASLKAATADGFTISWPAADRAESYSVYLDGELVADQITGTTYTDVYKRQRWDAGYR